MKINKHEIWSVLIQLSLMCLKHMKEMFSPNVTWYSYFFIPCQSFFKKEQNHWRNFFSSTGNAICSSLLKYQEIYVQIQTFT